MYFPITRNTKTLKVFGNPRFTDRYFLAKTITAATGVAKLWLHDSLAPLACSGQFTSSDTAGDFRTAISRQEHLFSISFFESYPAILRVSIDDF